MAGVDVLEQWAAIHATAPQAKSLGDEIEERREQSLYAKKKLLDETKAFKKLDEAGKLSGLSEILKLYQGEIDALNKRAKFAEGAFAQLQTVIENAPSPDPIRDQLAAESSAKNESTAALEAQMKEKDTLIAKLRSALKDMENEFSTVTNQAATVRNLNKRVKELEAEVEETKKQKDEEWGRKLENLKEELGAGGQKAQQEQAQNTQILLQQQQELIDEIERLKQQHVEDLNRADEAVHARAAEVVTLSSDIERLQGELEHERLKQNEHRETQSSVAVFQSLLDDTQQRVIQAEREAASLRQQLEQADESAKSKERAGQADLSDMAKTLTEKDQEIRLVKEQLSLRPTQEDVDNLKQQLRNIETVEAGNFDLQGVSDLETRLLQKQKSLASQLSEARVQSAEQQAEIESLTKSLENARDETKDAKLLIKRLETELSETSGQSEARLPPPEAGAAALLNTLGDETAGTMATGKDAAMLSMEDIVKGQRDRFRARAGELEVERDKWKSSSEQERKRAEAVHADNVRLTERIRYLQSFQPKQGAPRRGKGGRDPDLEARYGGNSFTNFQDEERRLRIEGLGLHERVLANLGTVLAASKPARLITFGYMVTIHLLIMTILFRITHTACNDNHH